jgi:CubicO group peptidase (beta-lactamase class C family)
MHQTLVQPYKSVIMSFKFNSNCLKFSLLYFFLLFFQLINAQKNFKELEAKIEGNRKLLGDNLVVIIAGKDSVLFQKQVGEFNTKTVAPIASCSKWLTAALVMQAVDEGKISLDDKVAQYLPVYERYGKNYITIRHCLSHMTGIQTDGGRLGKLLERKKYSSLDEEVAAYAAKEIQNNPGEAFRYGAIGLNIAGRVLEVVYKKKFEILIKQKLFSPLGMRKTSFATLDGSAPNPSGGAVSMAEDYLKFLQMLLNNGSYNGQQILSVSSVQAMRQIMTTANQIKYAPKSAEGFLYASGSWVLESKDGKIATALASPGLFGTWPMIDYSRGYAALFFVKNLLGEERADAYMELKKVIDQQFVAK